MTQETKKIADSLIQKGHRVFINENEEIFTEESLAKLAKIKYTEYTNPKILLGDDGKVPSGKSTPATEIKATEKPLSKMNKAELTAKASSLGLEVSEDNTAKEIIAIIETKLAEESDKKDGASGDGDKGAE